MNFISIFYFFIRFAIIFFSAVIILSPYSIFALLSLILLFASLSMLFISISANFIGMLLLVIYLGAISVIFLLFIMVVNQKQNTLSKLNLLTINNIMKCSLLIIFPISSLFCNNFIEKNNMNYFSLNEIGVILYEKYLPIFQSSGILLLVSIIGSIIILKFRNIQGSNVKYISGNNILYANEVIKDE